MLVKWAKKLKYTKNLKEKNEDELINNKCIQNCDCYYDDMERLIRSFEDKDIYDWELNVYLRLIKFEICPLITVENGNFIYDLNGYMSLRNCLKEINNEEKETIVLNELFCFTNKLIGYRFVHGNLHVDNIFINYSNLKIVVIDYANSYIDSLSGIESHKRTSFLGEYEKKKLYKNFLNYWDFFTIYVSLKCLYRHNANMLNKIQDLAHSYIPDKVFAKMLRKILVENTFAFDTQFYL